MRRLLVTLVVLLALAAGADRLAAWTAERRVAQRIQAAERLSRPPEVRIGGFPFLTQALAGRYDDVRVTAYGVRRPSGVAGVADVRIDSVTAYLRGVRLPLRTALAGPVTTLPVSSIDATALVRYADLSAALPDRHLSFSAEGDRLRLRGQVTVLGQRYAASALGTLSLRGDQLTVVPRAVSVNAGPGALAVPPALIALLSVTVRVALPFGLRLTAVSVAADGLHLQAGGRDVVLRALNRPGPAAVD